MSQVSWCSWSFIPSGSTAHSCVHANALNTHMTVCAQQDVTMETHSMCSGLMGFRPKRSEDGMNETVEGEWEVSDPARTRENRLGQVSGRVHENLFPLRNVVCGLFPSTAAGKGRNLLLMDGHRGPLVCPDGSAGAGELGSSGLNPVMPEVAGPLLARFNLVEQMSQMELEELKPSFILLSCLI